MGVRDLPGGHGGVLHVGMGARQAQREVAREAREPVEALILKMIIDSYGLLHYRFNFSLKTGSSSFIPSHVLRFFKA